MRTKIFIPLFLLLGLIASNSYAQSWPGGWTNRINFNILKVDTLEERTSGQGIYVSGKMGLGVAPVGKFDVKSIATSTSAIRILRDDSANLLFNIGQSSGDGGEWQMYDGNGNRTIVLDGATGAMGIGENDLTNPFGVYNSVTGSDSDFVVKASGNTGIGTATPGVKLEIEGGISIGDTTGFVLSSAAATVTSESNVILDTEGGAARDTCTTLTGVIGQIVYISTRVSGRDIDFLDSGNFSLAAECNLTDVADVLVLKATSATTWKGLGCNNNN